ncbi:MAG: PEP-CTERM sorting domain-containing protein [Pirellulaceae bacterium]|nr:PEP-CTERM sorting domain-containing protein [Pirellulaceae bacterium]
MRSNNALLLAFSTVALLAGPALPIRADILDFNEWTRVQDPADPNFTSSVLSPTEVQLLAGNGPVPSGTDIGYQSVDGTTAAGSTVGHAFSPAADFTVAIDFSLAFQPSGNVGGLAIGFGIGEDRDGANSAGAVLLSQNGSFALSPVFGAAARVNDVTQTPKLILLAAQPSGSFFASYHAASGDVTLGVGGVGAVTPTATATYAGIANQWNGDWLFPAFFLRSDAVLGQAWTSGGADARFRNFRVISGESVAVPEPGTLAMLALGGMSLAFARRRCGPWIS